MTTLSALALATTLGACGSSPEQSAQSDNNDDQQSSSDAALQDVSALVSQASTTMDSKKTVTMKISIEGGAMQGSPAAGLQNQTCRADLNNARMACEGAGESVFTEDAVYMKMPGQGQSGKPWMKQDLNSSQISDSMGQLGKTMQFSNIESILPAGSEITDQQQVQLNGQQATRYDVTTDLQKAAAEAEGVQKKSAEMLINSGVTETEKTVWVDSNNLLMKVENVTPAMKIAGQQVPETTQTVTYSDWGEPVDITVPPASKVSEF
ncbi:MULTISPECIES: hypothetical protein [unclassified Actinopolyspora]|uniref:hypothetical protein n=1 Tax=unclassified Actinopolyspora TaxID=2639451 RepID=UPI0013F6597E|nr:MULTISPECIES: hypothetical protein [unclassified Actinopolyspora]NHD18596.1 hypothetical protein [Actinopolyspora sp. BKK2]NHE78082.1 hypothetical protein [Actinopolyspora sp. BKK1]